MGIQSGNNEARMLVHRLAVTGGASSTGIFAYSGNPWGVDVIITKAVLRITTQSGAASTLDIGVGATAATANDTLFDGLSGAAAGLFDNVTNKGTNGLPQLLWADDAFLVVEEKTGNVDALVAELYIQAVPVI
jgi:hypothetical protein